MLGTITVFSTHPTLVLTCKLPTISRPHAVWKLPKPFSCHSFDRDLSEQMTPESNFTLSFDEGHFLTKMIQKPANLWTQQTEKTLAGAACDKNGHNIKYPPSILADIKDPNWLTAQLLTLYLDQHGMMSRTPNKFRVPNAPPTSSAISEDYIAMVGLYRAREKNPTMMNHKSCQELWQAICNAPGFGKHGFPKWFCDRFTIPFFIELPTIHIVTNVRVLFGNYFQDLSRTSKEEHKKINDEKYQHDWENGGALTFAALRECGPAPCCYVGKTVQTTVKKVRWHKQGLTKLPCQDLTNFNWILWLHFKDKMLWWSPSTLNLTFFMLIDHFIFVTRISSFCRNFVSLTIMMPYVK